MFEKEVAKGSAWLDRMNPGWYREISLPDLDLSDYGECSLGQTLGPSVSKNLCYDHDFSEPHGFSIATKKKLFGIVKGKFNRHYRLLTSAWIQEILRRREMDRMTNNAIEAVTK